MEVVELSKLARSASKEDNNSLEDVGWDKFDEIPQTTDCVITCVAQSISCSTDDGDIRVPSQISTDRIGFGLQMGMMDDDARVAGTMSNTTPCLAGYVST